MGGPKINLFGGRPKGSKFDARACLGMKLGRKNAKDAKRAYVYSGNTPETVLFPTNPSFAVRSDFKTENRTYCRKLSTICTVLSFKIRSNSKGRICQKMFDSARGGSNRHCKHRPILRFQGFLGGHPWDSVELTRRKFPVSLGPAGCRYQDQTGHQIWIPLGGPQINLFWGRPKGFP